MPINCDPEDLAAASTCFQQCVPNGMAGAIEIYLLQQIAGNSETVDELIESAKCINQCVPKGFEKAIITYLLCVIANQ